MKVGNFIRSHRTRLKLTQEELAIKSNLSRQTIVSVERNQNSVSLNTLNSLLVSLGLNFASLDNAFDKQVEKEFDKNNVCESDREKIKGIINGM